uniref:Uncharacterized protein n=1 Tax=Acrobeloides nanus TaxID=290746 RepID=A0A914DZC6_9BILA
MGACQSQDDPTMTSKTKAIDRELKQAHMEEQKIVKLLLLGAGECGKSTVLKQMRILHNNFMSDDEIYQQKAVIYNNTVTSMVVLLRGMNTLGIKLDDPSRENDARLVLEVAKKGEESEPPTSDLARAIASLWQDRGVKERAFSRGNEFQLQDTAAQ